MKKISKHHLTITHARYRIKIYPVTEVSESLQESFFNEIKFSRKNIGSMNKLKVLIHQLLMIFPNRSERKIITNRKNLDNPNTNRHAKILEQN